MAGTIIDYVKEYGDLTWEEFPMNDVDSLVLCQLAYLKFDGLVPGIRENKASVTLKDISIHADYEKLYADERYEKSNRALFEAVLHSRRYAKLRLNCYINIIEKEWETQFSAVTFLLEDGSLYIAYRGTDETIIGWKEDFNMAFLDLVPGQAYSVKYLNMVAGKLRNPLYLGGHSKGGNLAVYAAMKCLPTVKKRIRKIYSMDGPGFRPEVLTGCKYEEIAERVVKIMPHSSVVGMLFEKDIHYKTIESKTFGLAQHNPFTWVVKDGQFVDAGDIYESRRFMDEAINEWILSLDEKQLRTFVDTFYQLISASQAEDLITFASNWRKSLTGIREALKEVDDKTMEMLKAIVRSLFDIMGERIRREWRDKPKKKLKAKKRPMKKPLRRKSLLKRQNKSAEIQNPDAGMLYSGGMHQGNGNPLRAEEPPVEQALRPAEDKHYQDVRDATELR